MNFGCRTGPALIYVSYLKGQQGRTISRFNPDTGVNEAVIEYARLFAPDEQRRRHPCWLATARPTPVDVKDTGGYTIDNDPYLACL